MGWRYCPPPLSQKGEDCIVKLVRFELFEFLLNSFRLRSSHLVKGLLGSSKFEKYHESNGHINFLSRLILSLFNNLAKGGMISSKAS